MILAFGFLTATQWCIAAEQQLAHMVFFTLKEDTPANRVALIEACNQHLSDHEGTVYFSAGAIADDLDREVNDKSFDVALHIVFENRQAHDTYQTHPRHLLFIEENKNAWSNVRVFDSNLPSAASPTDRQLANKIRFSSDRMSLSEVVKKVVKAYAEQHNSDGDLSVSLVAQDLKLDGITVNQRLPAIPESVRSVEELLTLIVQTANPFRNVTSLSDPNQKLVWAVSKDGQSLLILTRDGAKRAGMELPEAFRLQ